MKRALFFLLLVMPNIIPSKPAYSQADDKVYCAKLSDFYRRYVQNANGRRVDVEALQALEHCQKGDAAAAIPVLEKKLRQSGFSLPKEFAP